LAELWPFCSRSRQIIFGSNSRETLRRSQGLDILKAMIVMVAATGASNVIWGVVVGGVVGFVSSLGVAAFADYRKINEERRRFAALAAGSLSAVLHHLERHDVAGRLRDAAQAARNGLPPNILLIMPVRGSFLESVGKMESSLALLPAEIIGRTSRAVILIRGLIEDFTTLRSISPVGTASLRTISDFCDVLLSEIEEIQTLVPDLVEALRLESRTDRDILGGGSY
jgi:hypothetical protein